MIATSQRHLLARLVVLFGAVSLGSERVEAQSSTTPPKKTTTTVQVPKVDVTASEGSTATAIRGRPPTPSLDLSVSPPSPTALGQAVTLGVRPAALGAMYRFVATMTFTGTGMPTAGTTCSTSQTIGTGSNVSWTPASGAYRLTVHAVRSLAAHDSTALIYQVNAPHGGFLNMTVTQNPNPQPPGRLMLSLHTNDRGAGSRYQWVVRFTPAFGAPSGPPVDWTGDSPVPVYSAPFVLTPGTYNVSARVGIHQGDPCRIVETSTGALVNRVIQ